MILESAFLAVKTNRTWLTKQAINARYAAKLRRPPRVSQRGVSPPRSEAQTDHKLPVVEGRPHREVLMGNTFAADVILTRVMTK